MSTVEQIDLSRYERELHATECIRWSGRVTDVTGLVIESQGPASAVGTFCEIETAQGRTIRSQVAGFRNGRILSIPLEEVSGVEPGDAIHARSGDAQIAVGPGLLGRVLDGFGKPMDGGGPIEAVDRYELFASPPGPLERAHVDRPLITGIRAIDSLLPCGLGQRIGIFGGSGVGKSTLLGCMARDNSADVSVIALIGERNREVREFLDCELGAEGRKRSVLVVATSDQPAPLRVRACFVAAAVAEYFRDEGKNVLLVMDSVTRLAMAQREIGLAAGEPPSQKGYTPSVFALLPRLFERAGAFGKGTITGFFTVLVEGDDMNEPIADAVRSILDGHIVLSRSLGAGGHYPAIDVLSSVSRVASRVAAPDHLKNAQKLREALASYQNSEDLINLGAYVSGTNPKLDLSIKARDRILKFLRQQPKEKASQEQTLEALAELASAL
ncbi:MAG: FliI/YscN family ATPase [Acidobacteriaceae bacterium]|nr:FliI/YscN family ATPase [Acidobacteriaceae bacterium]